MARIEQINAFCKVVDLHSFSQAAEALGLSQPTISLQIKALEEEFGTELLHRDGYKILPTENGQFIYTHFIRILALYDRALEGIHSSQGTFSGSIRIGASSGPGEHPLPQILARFKQAHPECEVSMFVGDSYEIMEKVAGQTLEVGFVGDKRRDGRLRFEPFIEDRLILVAAKDSSYAKNKSIPYEDLAQIPLIIQQPGSGATSTLQRALSEVNLHISDLNILMQLGLQDSVKSAVASGIGATIISYLGAKKEIESGELVQIDIPQLDLHRNIYQCQNRETPLTNIAQEFVTFAFKYKNI
jgi:DNA-binding transcriptional LysR family regulator